MAFKWEKLTAKSQEAVQAAASTAAENGNPEVLPLHLLAALLEDREGGGLPVVSRAGAGAGPRGRPPRPRPPPRQKPPPRTPAPAPCPRPEGRPGGGGFCGGSREQVQGQD